MSLSVRMKEPKPSALSSQIARGVISIVEGNGLTIRVKLPVDRQPVDKSVNDT